MLKPLLPMTSLLLIILAALMACTAATPTPDPMETPAAGTVAATTSPPVSTPEPVGPNPTTSTAFTEAPSNSPTRRPQAPKLLTALNIVRDTRAAAAHFSETELKCLGGNPARIAYLFDGEGSSPTGEREKVIACLDDQTLEQIFLGFFLPNAGTLEPESSDCLRAAFLAIRPREIMTGKSDRGGSITTSVAIAACLSDREWTAAAHQLHMDQEERDAAVCIMAVLGGPAELVIATIDWVKERRVEEETALFQAGLECGMEAPSEPAAPEPATATSTQMHTATTEASTPSPARPTAPSTPAPTTATVPSTPDSTTLVITVAETPAGIPEYSRSEWKHWTDEDGDCQDARQEVLIAESLEPVTYEDDRQCRVATGRWWAPYLGHHLGNPGHIDVDHHVPLKNAHLSGGWQWDADRKQEYANDLTNPAHLIAISARHNRSKGARGPEEWAPPDNSLWCDYATDWAEIKQEWSLTMTPVESEIVMDMLHTCEDPPEYEVETLDYLESATGEDKQTAEPEGTVYGSCEDAATAGEDRIQGSHGGGEGFPKAMVPSARDGDGDGIVCER